jgi:hypothetical protein
MNRIKIILLFPFFILLSCTERKSLESNFDNIIQIVNYENYSVTKSSYYSESVGDEQYYLELYDQQNKFVDSFRGYIDGEGSFRIDSVNKKGIFVTWPHFTGEIPEEIGFKRQFNEYKTKFSKLGDFVVHHNTKCFNSSGLGRDILFDNFKIIGADKIEFIYKDSIVAKFKICDLNLKPHLAFVEHKSNNLNIVGGKACNNSLTFHSILSTRSPKFDDSLKNEIKKLAITNAIANAGLRVR